MPRERFRIPFRFGLDRFSGHLSTSPGTMIDLRNALLGPGRIEMRKGMGTIATLSDTTDIIGVHAMKRENIGVVVSYDSSDGSVRLWRTDEDGTLPNLIGLLPWSIDPGSDPPRVIMTETTQRVYIAHDALRLVDRQPTVYYDPFSTTDINLMESDLNDDATDETVYFRGVMTWKDYLVGWSFGNEDEDRPEIVRISRPGITELDPRHYFLAGAQRDPVVGCYEAGGTIVVFKENETYRIQGTATTNFGIVPIDQYFGLAAPRLAVTVGRRCYFWSFQGPRFTDGFVESSDIALPLDLQAPSPADLVEEGATANGFCVYEPEQRLVKFYFGKRVYVLNLVDLQSPQWSYFELGVPVLCGGLLYGDIESNTAPPLGPPVFDSGNSSATDVTLTVAVDHDNDPSTDNIVEIYLKKSAEGVGGWYRATAFQSNGGSDQTQLVTGVDPGTDYDVSLRYRAGPHYNPGAEDDSDPSAWPAVSQGTISTTLAAPTLNSVDWERTAIDSEKFVVNITPEYADVDMRIHLDPEAAVSRVISVPATGNTDPFDYDLVLESDESESEQYCQIFVDHTTTEVPDGADSATLEVWAGPNAEPGSFGLTETLVAGNFSPDPAVNEAGWTNADTIYSTEVFWAPATPDSPIGPGDLAAEWTSLGESGVNDVALDFHSDASWSTNDDIYFTARHVLEHASGKDDFGPPITAIMETVA